MKEKSMKTAILNCTAVSSDIMNKIDTKLKSEGVSFTHNNQAEIIVSGKKKDDISSMINNLDGVEETQTKLLVQVSEGSDNVFIRQKFN